MTKRSFDDAFWGDPFVQDLDKDAKLLFAYLWTNKRCNSAGLYEITLKTISFDTGIPQDTLQNILEHLATKVKWLADKNIVWVKNFLKHQPKSPLFLKAVADCLVPFSTNGIVQEYLDYNRLLGISIPYQYPMHTVSGGYVYQQEPEQEQDIDIEQHNKGVLGGKNGGEKQLGIMFKVFEDNFQKLTDNTKHALLDFVDTYGLDKVLVALDKAVRQNKRNLAYVEGILKGDGDGVGKGHSKKAGDRKGADWGDPLR